MLYFYVIMISCFDVYGIKNYELFFYECDIKLNMF